MNARNSALRAGSPRSATVPSRHASHLHRWERAFVNPFLRIARPHKGHFLALEDLFLLIDQANPKSQAPRRINARLANHTPTHKTPVSLTADLRHTFLYLTPNFSKGFYYSITREGGVSGIGGVEVYP